MGKGDEQVNLQEFAWLERKWKQTNNGWNGFEKNFFSSSCLFSVHTCQLEKSDHFKIQFDLLKNFESYLTSNGLAFKCVYTIFKFIFRVCLIFKEKSVFCKKIIKVIIIILCESNPCKRFFFIQTCSKKRLSKLMFKVKLTRT